MSPAIKRVVLAVAILILLMLSCRVLPAAMDAMSAAINAFDWAGSGHAAGTALATWGKAVIMWFMPVIMWFLKLF